jgi:hypothetical protein
MSILPDIKVNIIFDANKNKSDSDDSDFEVFIIIILNNYISNKLFLLF